MDEALDSTNRKILHELVAAAHGEACACHGRPAAADE